MYNDYYNGDNISKQKFSLNNFNLKSKLILGVIVLIGLIIALIIANSVKNYFNSYEYLEKQMISNAKDYVNKNNLIVRNEMYLNITKLDIEVKKNCTITSGVFVDSNYKYKAYLDCENYKTDIINNKNEEASLKGDEVIILGKGVTYKEEGITGNNDVKIVGEVGVDEGVYNLKYIILSNNTILDTLERKVVVIDEIYINNLYPSLILNGDKIEYVQKGHKYEDKGVFAGDVVDLNLDNKVKRTGNVNINNVGEYEITYSVTNSRGYTNSVARKIIVVDNFSSTIVTSYITPETLTSGSVTINLKIVGDNYSYTLLPDGSETSDNTIEYAVSQNKTYNFISYDKDGKNITKIVIIDNIDNTKPNAICTAYVYDKYTQVVTAPYSGKKIESYNYTINGVSSGEIISSNYKSNITDVSKVSVAIKDNIGNSNDINCTINKGRDVRKIYVNDKGKKCLSGYICYSQYYYSSPSVQFCSTDTCGPISKRGCSVTATATAISLFQLKDSKGNIYDPYSLTTEVFNKVCSNYCSGSTAIYKAAVKLGLSATGSYSSIKGHEEILKQFLKNGYPVIFRAGKGAYTESGHLLAILGINENDEVFLSDPGSSGTTSSQSSSHRVNSWVPISEIASGQGESAWFMAIGPAGLYNNSMSD